MIIVSIDPGVDGALAVFAGGNLIGIHDLPVLDGEVQVGEFASLLDDIGPDLVVIEKTQAMPKSGSIARFSLGLNSGLVRATVTTQRRSLELVRPTQWKRNLGLIGTNKDRSLAMANQLYPAFAEKLRLKKHHNRADAILIGRWAVGQHIMRENANA